MVLGLDVWIISCIVIRQISVNVRKLASPCTLFWGFSVLVTSCFWSSNFILSSHWHLIVPNGLLPWNLPWKLNYSYYQLKSWGFSVLMTSCFYSSNFIVPNGLLPWNLPMKIKPLSTKIIFKMLLVCQSKQLYCAFK